VTNEQFLKPVVWHTVPPSPVEDWAAVDRLIAQMQFDWTFFFDYLFLSSQIVVFFVPNCCEFRTRGSLVSDNKNRTAWEKWVFLRHLLVLRSYSTLEARRFVSKRRTFSTFGSFGSSPEKNRGSDFRVKND
jgi:hypothetical protein